MTESNQTAYLLKTLTSKQSLEETSVEINSVDPRLIEYALLVGI